MTYLWLFFLIGHQKKTKQFLPALLHTPQPSLLSEELWQCVSSRHTHCSILECFLCLETMAVIHFGGVSHFAISSCCPLQLKVCGSFHFHVSCIGLLGTIFLKLNIFFFFNVFSSLHCCFACGRSASYSFACNPSLIFSPSWFSNLIYGL